MRLDYKSSEGHFNMLDISEVSISCYIKIYDDANKIILSTNVKVWWWWYRWGDRGNKQYKINELQEKIKRLQRQLESEIIDLEDLLQE